MTPIRFGIVGCGRISEKHLQALRDVDGVELAAVCDRVEARALEKAEKYGVPAFSSVEEMLAGGTKIDAVSVLTESGDHARTSLAVLDAGRHVLVEKPMAITLDDAESMILAADRARRRLFVVKQNRYNKPVVRAKEYLDAGRFGKLVMGTIRVRWCRTQAYYDQDPWRGTWHSDGGVLTNKASHHIDLLQWFLGDPETVYAQSRTALVDIEAEDTAAAIIRFSSGAIGVVEATTATRPRDLEGSFSLLGEKGAVVLGGFAVNRVDAWQFDDDVESKSIRDELSVDPPDVYGFGHRHVYQNIRDSLVSGGPALVDGFEGVKSLRLITALYESVETGLPVSLRFRPQRCQLGGVR